MKTRLRHAWLALVTMARLVVAPSLRPLWWEMRAYCRALPDVFKPPLQDALTRLTTDCRPLTVSPDTLRDLSDVAALLERRSPFGLCLRRSLLRYRFLRAGGVPVALRFGARFVDGKPDREVTGHAWLTLDGKPYYEAQENWRDFTTMITWPTARDGKINT